MRTRLLRAALAAGVALATPVLAQSRAGGIADPDTREWWKITEVLSSDAMEGRDIGSPGYDRAADVIARRFKAAGLKPAGDNGTWFQTFPVHEVKVESAAFVIVRDGGGTAPLRFLQQISVRPTDVLAPSLVGALTFRGYCRAEDLADVKERWSSASIPSARASRPPPNVFKQRRPQVRRAWCRSTIPISRLSRRAGRPPTPERSRSPTARRPPALRPC
jgi:hypothetical protein